MAGSLAFRRAMLAGFWGSVTVFVTAWAVNTGWLTTEDVTLGVAFTVVAALLTRWSSLDSARIEYDPAGTFVVGTAFAVSPAAAPVVLVAQAIVMGLTDGISKRRHPHHVVANIGLMAAWHGLLAFLVPHVLDATGGSLVRFLVGMTVCAALTTVFNYLTVALSAVYLYGSEAATPTGGVDQLKDTGLAIAIGAVMWISSAWSPAVLAIFVFTPVYASVMFRRTARRTAALALEISARVTTDEAMGPNPDHTRRVRDLVMGLLGPDDASAERVALATWSHGPLSSAYPHRCSGVEYDSHLLTAIRSIPSSRRIERLVPTDGMPDSHPASHLIAAACAWDSRRMEGSPVRTPDDLVYTFGIDRKLVDRLVELDPGWVSPEPRMPAGTSVRE